MNKKNSLLDFFHVKTKISCKMNIELKKNNDK